MSNVNSVNTSEVNSVLNTANANKLIADVVSKTWKSGVINKLKLGEKVFEGYSNILRLDPTEFQKPDGGGTDDAAMKRKIKDLRELFLNSLPFGEAVADKFNRIGGTAWLYEFDMTKLPNCYNTLDKLSGKNITRDDFILDYIKTKLTTNSRVIDVGGWVKAALVEKDKAEAAASRINGEPDPETNIVEKFASKEASITTGDASSTTGDASSTTGAASNDNVKKRKTIAFKVMINPEEITANKENFTRLIGLFDEIETLISENKKIVSCEVVGSVKTKLMKSFTDAAVAETEKELSLAA
jgi:hypothetical protein